jgi:hypothetical protein
MAKRKRSRRRFGATAQEHGARAKSTIREIKRLQGALRRQLQNPPDCVHAANLNRALAEQEGAYLIDRFESSARTGKGLGSRALHDRFVKVCVVHPRNRRASQNIHEVWR